MGKYYLRLKDVSEQHWIQKDAAQGCISTTVCCSDWYSSRETKWDLAEQDTAKLTRSRNERKGVNWPGC